MHALRKITAGVAVAAIGLGLAACGGGQPAAQKRESAIQQSSYDRLSKQQPAQTMNYSPTRASINFWIKTWDEPGKLAYVYLQAANGQLLGYYVFEGLPVSYCAGLTPSYRTIDQGDQGADLVVPAPSVDGVYYSGGQCNAYYGKDATSGTYIEYTAGQGISALVYSEPLPRADVQPLGFTTIKDGK